MVIPLLHLRTIFLARRFLPIATVPLIISDNVKILLVAAEPLWAWRRDHSFEKVHLQISALHNVTAEMDGFVF